MFTNIIERAKASGLNGATATVLLISMVLAFLHHGDHVLRVDHSGWPFRANVTTFTYSLMAYPVILFALFGPRRLYWLRWLLLAAATAFTLYAHTVVENPLAQFTMWSQNHSVHYDGVHNALNAQSPLLGVVAVVVSMALNIVAVVATVMMLIGGLRSPPNPPI